MTSVQVEDLFQICFEDLQMDTCNWTYTNESWNRNQNQSQILQKLLLRILGPRTSSFFLPISLTYLLIFITGVTGNLLTCTVIAKHRKMRTPTNLYLFSLAISDLMVLIFGMPLETYEMWQNYPFPFGESGCYFKTFLFETVCFASVLNVTALSVERYIAVVHPLKTKHVMTNTHARRVISTIWVTSLLCAIPNTSLHGIYYIYLPSLEKIEESATCSMLKPKWMYNLVIQITTIFFYFVPVAVITVLYLLIGCQLTKEKKFPIGKLGKNCNSNTSWKIHLEHGRRRQITKMLCVVVIVFIICWAPFHTDRLLWSFITHWTDVMHTAFQYVHILSGIFFYLSAAVNPIIYNLLSTKFRERFREIVCRNPDSSLSYSSSPAFCKTHRSSSRMENVVGLPDKSMYKDYKFLPVNSHLSWSNEDETSYM
ncbi:neuromedin-U receptor 2-like [Microcaecilia unicolor]|uniref:Neuromedin-U receptor 2-like n=1 Tax=Microcaecilia unicolor TaxID=1415580 RepID=A0A6P7WFP7_9AMPH|nr:neuromedin-U receptor 2-like [Microcaecilia unicolor]